MSDSERCYFDNHPIITTLMCWSIFLVVLVLVSEIGMRFFIAYSPNYYIGSKSALKTGLKKTITYPWGEIYINSDGLPDQEFHPTKQSKRIAYVGDSVCFGIGAGYGHRVSEHLEKRFPQYEHMNLGYTSDAVPGANLIALTEKYRFDKVIYLMNLNDILPTAPAARKEIPMNRSVNWLRKKVDWLRTRSYLYSYLRFTFKNLVMRMGYEVHGQVAYERYPQQYRHVIADTAKQIGALNQALKQQGAELIVVMMPYEMQISEEAAQTYWKYGIRWEDDFIDRGTQKQIMQALKQLEIPVVDGYWAFINAASRQQDRAKNKLGQYYVYNKGDKLDWNHMNRLGQKVLADYLAVQIPW